MQTDRPTAPQPPDHLNHRGTDNRGGTMQTFSHNGICYEIGPDQTETDRRLGHLLAQLWPTYLQRVQSDSAATCPAPLDGAETPEGLTTPLHGGPAYQPRPRSPGQRRYNQIAARRERLEPCRDVLCDGKKEAPH